MSECSLRLRVWPPFHASSYGGAASAPLQKTASGGGGGSARRQPRRGGSDSASARLGHALMSKLSSGHSAQSALCVRARLCALSQSQSPMSGGCWMRVCIYIQSWDGVVFSGELPSVVRRLLWSVVWSWSWSVLVTCDVCGRRAAPSSLASTSSHASLALASASLQGQGGPCAT